MPFLHYLQFLESTHKKERHMSDIPESRKKKNKNKELMKKAVWQVRAAYIMALLYEGVYLIMKILAAVTQEPPRRLNMLDLLDVALVVVLALFIMLFKSRAAAVILLILFGLPRIVLFIASQATAWISLLIDLPFFVAFVFGVIGTYAYQKLTKEEKKLASKKH